MSMLKSITRTFERNKTVSRTLKMVILCFFAGGVAGTLTAVVGCHTGYLLWSGIAIAGYAVTLCVSVALSRRFSWIHFDVSRKQILIAFTLIAAIYPISLVAILFTAFCRLYRTLGRDSLAFDMFSYSTLLRHPLGELVDVERSIMLSGLTLAVFLGAILLAGSLRVLTKKWDVKVMVLMMVAIVGTPFLTQIVMLALTKDASQAIASILSRVDLTRLSTLQPLYPQPTLFCHNDSLLHVFPLGNAFITALCGFWIRRADAHGENARASLPTQSSAV